MIGVAQSAGADRRDQPRRHVHGGGARPRARQLRRRPLRVPAGDADHPRRRPVQGPDLLGPNGNGIRGEAVVAAVSAAIAAIICVHFLLRYFKRGNLIPFGIYCLVFGGAMVIYNA